MLVAVVVVVVGMLASGAVAQASWQIESLAPAASMMSAPALVFDGQDRAQIVYGADTASLQHVRGSQAGAMPGWTSSGLPSFPGNSFGMQVDLAAAGNRVYLGSSGPLSSISTRNYAAIYDGTAWTPVSNFMMSTSIRIVDVATDAAGHDRWLVSAGNTNVDPGRGITTVGTWLLDTTSPTQAAVKVTSQTFIPPRPPVGGTAAMNSGGQMFFDSSGNLQMAQYYEGSAGGSLMYINGPAAGPFSTSDNLDPGWQVKMGQPSLALDGAGNPRIAYTQQWPYYGVKYLAWNGTGWDSEWIDQGGSITGYIGTFPELIIDQAGQVHVIYADLLNGLLKHALRTGGGWQIETIDQVGTQAATGVLTGSLAAAMDSRGGIGVAYWSGQAGQMKYAYLVPEPATMALLIAAGGLLLRRRRA
jgi:hypothetical protein